MKNLLFLTTIIVIIESVCLYCMKKGKENNTAELCTLGTLGFLLVGYMFNKTIEHGQLGSMAIVLEALTILSAFIMGYIWFEEKWNHRKTIAILLSFIAIAIIYVEESQEHSKN